MDESTDNSYQSDDMGSDDYHHSYCNWNIINLFCTMINDNVNINS